MNDHKKNLTEKGFVTIDKVYTDQEIEKILSVIKSADSSGSTFRKSADLFAIRQFLREIPQTTSLIFNENLLSIIKSMFGPDFFCC